MIDILEQDEMYTQTTTIVRPKVVKKIFEYVVPRGYDESELEFEDMDQSMFAPDEEEVPKKKISKKVEIENELVKSYIMDFFEEEVQVPHVLVKIPEEAPSSESVIGRSIAVVNADSTDKQLCDQGEAVDISEVLMDVMAVAYDATQHNVNWVAPVVGQLRDLKEETIEMARVLYPLKITPDGLWHLPRACKLEKQALKKPLQRKDFLDIKEGNVRFNIEVYREPIESMSYCHMVRAMINRHCMRKTAGMELLIRLFGMMYHKIEDLGGHPTITSTWRLIVVRIWESFALVRTRNRVFLERVWLRSYDSVDDTVFMALWISVS
jgi:hypothetical protein